MSGYLVAVPQAMNTTRDPSAKDVGKLVAGKARTNIGPLKHMCAKIRRHARTRSNHCRS
jgi:hypothetical protein